MTWCTEARRPRPPARSNTICRPVFSTRQFASRRAWVEKRALEARSWTQLECCGSEFGELRGVRAGLVELGHPRKQHQTEAPVDVADRCRCTQLWLGVMVMPRRALVDVHGGPTRASRGCCAVRAQGMAAAHRRIVRSTSRRPVVRSWKVARPPRRGDSLCWWGLAFHMALSSAGHRLPPRRPSDACCGRSVTRGGSRSKESGFASNSQPTHAHEWMLERPFGLVGVLCRQAARQMPPTLDLEPSPNSHCAKVLEEFFAQGDAEKRLGLPVQARCRPPLHLRGGALCPGAQDTSRAVAVAQRQAPRCCPGARSAPIWLAVGSVMLCLTLRQGRQLERGADTLYARPCRARSVGSCQDAGSEVLAHV